MKFLQSAVRSILLAPVTAATTARTANLDTQGADYATIVIVLGAEANTNATGTVLQLSESDDTVVTNFATFNAEQKMTLAEGEGAGTPLTPAGSLHVALTSTPDGEPGRVTLRAVRLSDPLTLDGRLDEEVYRQVAPASGFVQQEPNEGQPATEGEADVPELVNEGHRLSLQDRISQRFAVLDAEGNVVNDAPVILISDADLRDSKILSPAYQQALDDLANMPVQQRQAQEQTELEQLQGEARNEKARQDAAVTVTEAQAEADALNALGEATRNNPEALRLRPHVSLAGGAVARQSQALQRHPQRRRFPALPAACGTRSPRRGASAPCPSAPAPTLEPAPWRRAGRSATRRSSGPGSP